MKNAKQLIDVLAKTIDDVKMDPEYVDQAAQISGMAGRIVNIHKNQMEYHSVRGETPNIPFLASK